MSLGSALSSLRERAPLSIEEYWDWVAVALFLLVTLDMLTTIFASVEYGPIAEVNPLVRWALGHGVGALAALNLVSVLAAVVLFRLLIGRLSRAPAPADRYLSRLVEVWLGLLVAAGLAVFANNLSVVVLGESLF
ncbi:MAG: hypothetical protein ABEH77_09100 [Halobacteriaceae archaeon]